MKNSQKGSAALWVVIALVALVVLVVGAGYYFYLKNSSVQPEQATVNTPIQTATNPQPQPSVSTTSMQNCGEVINALSSDTAQQQKNTEATACMSQAITICSPATIVEPFGAGPGKKTFEILPSSGGYCPVSQTVDSPASKMTCNIPSDFISAISQFLQTKNQASMLFDAVPFFFVPASTPASARPVVKNPLTGQVVTVQCSSN